MFTRSKKNNLLLFIERNIINRYKYIEEIPEKIVMHRNLLYLKKKFLELAHHYNKGESYPQKYNQFIRYVYYDIRFLKECYGKDWIKYFKIKKIISQILLDKNKWITNHL